MKFYILAILFCFGLASSLYGEIYADVQTTEGTFTIKLDSTNSPLAVANFIGLATGSKTWIDSSTGETKSGVPYYNGIIFHRVIAGFMNQTGSQKGDGSDGPGYQFPDEFSTSDFTDSYLVAMANSGPQSNGSQFFITVSPRTYLNNVHTVFGSVPEDGGPEDIVDGSRDVIDAINAVTVQNSQPVVDVVIQSITIRRIEETAPAFDESAVALPSVAVPDLAINFPGLSSDPSLDFIQPAGSSFTLGLSPDLENWTTTTRYLDATAVSPLDAFVPGDLQTEKDRHFYTPSLVTWPSDAVFADSLANQTLTLITAVDANIPFIFTFDATGVTGTWSYPRAVDPLSGTILDTSGITNFIANGYGCRLILSLSGINFNIWSLNIGLDANSPTNLAGRTSGTAYFGSNTLDVGGTFNLTR